MLVLKLQPEKLEVFVTTLEIDKDESIRLDLGLTKKKSLEYLVVSEDLKALAEDFKVNRQAGIDNLDVVHSGVRFALFSLTNIDSAARC